MRPDTRCGHPTIPSGFQRDATLLETKSTLPFKETETALILEVNALSVFLGNTQDFQETKSRMSENTAWNISVVRRLVLVLYLEQW